MLKLKNTKIKSKKSLGIKPVYDIQVANDHHYILDNGIVSHNSGMIYASSIVVTMKKLKLKEDEGGNKVTDVRGIRAKCMNMKSRFNPKSLYKTVEVHVRFDTGMDLYSGCFDFFLDNEILEKVGNRYKYVTLEGEEIIEFKKVWLNKPELFDTIIAEYTAKLELENTKDVVEEIIEEVMPE